jgi:hypothetical protein
MLTNYSQRHHGINQHGAADERGVTAGITGYDGELNRIRRAHDRELAAVRILETSFSAQIFSMIFGSIFRYNPGHSGQEWFYTGQKKVSLGQEGLNLVDPEPVKGIEKAQADTAGRKHV